MGFAIHRELALDKEPQRLLVKEALSQRQLDAQKGPKLGILK